MAHPIPHIPHISKTTYQPLKPPKKHNILTMKINALSNITRRFLSAIKLIAAVLSLVLSGILVARNCIRKKNHQYGCKSLLLFSLNIALLLTITIFDFIAYFFGDFMKKPLRTSFLFIGFVDLFITILMILLLKLIIVEKSSLKRAKYIKYHLRILSLIIAVHSVLVILFFPIRKNTFKPNMISFLLP